MKKDFIIEQARLMAPDVRKKSGVFGTLLFGRLMLNWLLNPTRAVLEQLDITDYRHGISTDESTPVLT